MTVLNTAEAVYLGDAAADKVYLGATQVWPVPPWTPATLPGLIGWWDASTLALADGANVTSWPDLSGHGHDLTHQPAVQDGTAPRFVSAGLNGHDAVRYDGTNVLITETQADYRHFFAVAVYPHAQFLDYDGLLTGSEVHLLIGDGGGSNAWYTAAGRYHKNGVLEPSGPMLEPAVMSLSQSGGWGSMGPFRLGIDRVYGLNSGYNRYWIGDVAEVIGYDHELSDAERVQVETYLHDKWLTTQWTPASIPGLLSWFDAGTIAANDGDRLSYWEDVSGNGHRADTYIGDPTYDAAGVNGRPAVRFGKSNFSAMKYNPGLIGDRTIFQVIRTAGAPYGSFHSTQLQELDPFMQTYGAGTVHTYTTPDVDSGVPWSGSGQFITLWCDTGPHTQGLEVDGYRVNAAYNSAITSSTAPIHLGGFQPGSYAMNGWIAEFIVYSRVLDDIERAQVQEYLLSKFYGTIYQGPNSNLDLIRDQFATKNNLHYWD